MLAVVQTSVQTYGTHEQRISVSVYVYNRME